MSLIRKVLGGANAVTALVYLLRDEFTTTQAAPLTSLRTCEPGPGSWVITDTDNLLSIASDKLQCGAADGSKTFLSSVGTFSRVCGTAALIKYSGNGEKYFGFDTAQNDYSPDVASFRGALSIYAYDGSLTGVLDSCLNYTNRQVAVILRSAGVFVLFSEPIQYPAWTILWVGNTDTQSNLYLIDGLATTTSKTEDYIRIAQMSSPWNTNYGIATNRSASPSAGDTTTTEANALVEMTWTAVTGQTWELSVRRTDDDNRWIVRCDQAGSTIKLIERNAGVETERSSAAQTWTNSTAYRLVVIQDGNTIKTYVANVAKNSYASATFNNTATGVKTDKAGTNLIAWPRTLSGAALTELSKWTA